MKKVQVPRVKFTDHSKDFTPLFDRMTYRDNHLASSTHYTYTLKAVDAARSHSTALLRLAGLLPALAGPAPSNCAASTTRAMLSVSTNETASCAYSTNNAAIFAAMTEFSTIEKMPLFL
jgi:hypothetical protein